ncbi:hypothetical protein ABK040_012958 [Willaertia magna]
MGNLCAGGDASAGENDPRIKAMMQAKQQQQKPHRKVPSLNQKDKIDILLLGPGESGKSTFFKQIQFLQTSFPNNNNTTTSTANNNSPVVDNRKSTNHQTLQKANSSANLNNMNNNNTLSLYTKEELIDIRNCIYDNILQNMKILIDASRQLNIPIEKPENREVAQKITNIDSGLNFDDSERAEFCKNVKDLWIDEGMQRVFNERDKYQLLDSAEYFFNELDKISEEDYLPDVKDILHARLKSLGIKEYQHRIQQGMTMTLIDVGGQRNERKKWIHQFERVTAIIFFISLSEFDQTCYEDNSTWRVKESLTLFSEIVNNTLFDNTPFVLLLNKRDIFEKKLQRKKFSDYFKDFPTDRYDEKNPSDCISYIQELCLNEVKDKERINNGSLIVKILSAIDQDNTVQVFNQVKEFIVKHHEERLKELEHDHKHH